MDLQVWDESGPEPVRLKLVKVGSNIEVRAVDKNGKPLESSCLVVFESSGHIVRMIGVSYQLGFKLNRDGRILSTDE